MTRAAAIADERYFDERRLLRRPRAPRRDSRPRARIPTRGARSRALPRRRDAAQPRAPGLPLPDASTNPVGEARPVPDRRAHRGPGAATVLLLRPRRRDPRPGASSGAQGLDPWTLKRDGDRLYGRGTADNKGQHTHQPRRRWLRCSQTRGRLGFNVKVLIETGEEIGSPGPEASSATRTSRRLRGRRAASPPTARACSPAQPTMFLGTRGALNFDLRRGPARGRPPLGQLGRAARQPGHRARARARDASPAPTGEIHVPEWRPDYAHALGARGARRPARSTAARTARTIDAGLGRAGPHARRARVRLVRASRCSPSSPATRTSR